MSPPIEISIRQPELKARIKTKSETFGVGCLLQLIGIVLLFVFPVGTIIGIALFIFGAISARKRACSNCGTILSSRRVNMCPACKALFG